MNTELRQQKAYPVVLLFFSLWILWGFGFETVGTRLRIQLNGAVFSSQDIPPSRGPRYATEYVVRGPDGRRTSYIAGATDASLPRSMPVGTYIQKQKWRFYWKKNGERVDDFPIPFYALTNGIGIGLLSWCLVLWRRQDEEARPRGE